MFEDVHYPNNFIEQVIVRIDFGTSVDGVNKKLSKDVQEVARRRFPIPEPQVALGQQFVWSFQAKDDGVPHANTKALQARNWVFHGEAREKSIDISANYISMSISTYESYENLEEDFVTVCDAFDRSYADTVGIRLGMRFINKIVPRENDNLFSWEDYLSPSLLINIDHLPADAKIIRDFHNRELRFPECELKIQYGMANSDYPAEIRKKEFIIDLDAKTAEVIELNEIQNLLKKFHERIQENFESSIKDNVRNIMNER